MIQNTTIPFAINTQTKEKVFPEELLDKSLDDRRLGVYECYYCQGTVVSTVNEKNPRIKSWFRHKTSQELCEFSSYT